MTGELGRDLRQLGLFGGEERVDFETLTVALYHKILCFSSTVKHQIQPGYEKCAG